MINKIAEYRNSIDLFWEIIGKTPEAQCTIRLSADKWTLKEMIGHLIDSASNNHQRIVRLQLEEILIFPLYEAESWKNIQNINDFDWNTLTILWKNFNKLLLHIISNISKNHLNHYWKRNNENVTLEKLIEEYFNHIQFHFDLFKERLNEINSR